MTAQRKPLFQKTCGQSVCTAIYHSLHHLLSPVTIAICLHNSHIVLVARVGRDDLLGISMDCAQVNDCPCRTIGNHSISPVPGLSAGIPFFWFRSLHKGLFQREDWVLRHQALSSATWQNPGLPQEADLIGKWR